ncbi:MAG: type IV pili methyl-accepting chemotaxis transducer N-terminal domain-containing protein [Paracoccaceae bacterium]
MSRLRTLAAVAAVASAFCLPAAPALAFETEASVKAKINLAGRQRMLTQRIAKAACLVHRDVAPEASLAMLAGAHAAFTGTQQALRFGDPERNLRPEGSRQIVHFLDEVNEAWTPFGLAVKASLDEGAVTEARLRTIVEHDMEVLRRMDRAVRRMSRTHGAAMAMRANAKAIDWAGAQRMLTQRMAKDYCLIAAEIEPAASRFDLVQSVALFETRLAARIAGDDAAGVAPPSPEALAHLRAVETGWATLAPRLRAAGAGATPSEDDLATVVEALDALLVEAHAAVAAMEGASAETH